MSFHLRISTKYSSNSSRKWFQLDFTWWPAALLLGFPQFWLWSIRTVLVFFFLDISPSSCLHLPNVYFRSSMKVLFFFLLCIEFCFCGFEVVHVKWLKKILMAVIPTEPVCVFIYIAFPCVSDGSSIQTFSYSSSNMFEMALCSNSELKVHLRVTTVAFFPSVHLHTCICHSSTPHWSQLHSWHQ